ncbi:hypothetical protein [Bradyrhizobium cenepequi]
MSDKKVEIHVQTKRPRRFILLLIQALFWAMLIGSIAVSRIWLGGSFLVETLATIFSIVMLFKFARQFAGMEVEMSTDEVADWLRDGAPPDVKEWAAARSAKIATMPKVRP